MEKQNIANRRTYSWLIFSLFKYTRTTARRPISLSYRKIFLLELFITKFSLFVFVCLANQQYKIR